MIGLASVGLGLMGARLLESTLAHEGVRAVAGYDKDAARSDAAAGRFGLEVCTSLQDLLARRDVDVVHVATPPTSHLELGRAVLNSGRALLLEKPLAVDRDDAAAFVEEVESSGARAAVNFPFATLPGLRSFEEGLTSGRAGRPLRVEITLHFEQWPRSWHKAGEWLAGGVEGGFVREVFSHFAYLTRRLLGDIQLESATLSRDPAATSETQVEARMRAGGVPVSLFGGVGGAAPDFNRWTLYCENESYRVEDWSKVTLSAGKQWQDCMPAEGEGFGLQAQLDELVLLTRGQPSRLATTREGLDVVRVVEGIHASAGGS